MKLSIIIPLLNEQENLPELMHRVRAMLDAQKYDWELIFIDDGSTDRTPQMLAAESAKDARVKTIIFSRNFGHQAAITAGLQHAAGDLIAMIDGDLQDPPELIPALVEKQAEGYDVVYAIRENRKEAWWKNISYKIFYRLISAIASGVNLPLDAGDFSLVTRRAIDALNAMPENNRYIRGLRSWVGFRQTGVRYNRDTRFAGVSKYTLWKMIKLAYDGIFSFSYFPITAVGVLGFLAALGAFIGIIIILYLRLFTEKSIPGFASTAIITLFFGGIQLLAIGTLGEYIRRIYDEVKRRPLYVVKQTIGLP